jgi:integrase
MAIEVELTEAFIETLTFERMVLLKGDGTLTTKKTPKGTHGWELRDGGLAGVQGLVLRVWPTSMTWTVRRKLHGVSKRWRIGAWKSAAGHITIPLELARKRAREWFRLLDEGIDPDQARRQRREITDRKAKELSLTMAVVYAAYVEAKSTKGSDKTDTDRRKVPAWMKGSPIWHKPILDITRGDVEATYRPLLDHIAHHKRLPAWGPSTLSVGTLNKMWGYVAAAFKRGARELDMKEKAAAVFSEWRSDNDWPEAPKKTAFLKTESEQGQAWLRGLIDLRTRAMDPDILVKRPDPRSKDLKPHVAVMASYVLLALCWGTRLNEAASLRIQNLDFGRRIIELPGEITKTGQAAVLPMTAWTEEILREQLAWNETWRGKPTKQDWVFPSRERGRHIGAPNSVLRALEVAAGVRITTHDLRRTLATDFSKLKVQQEDMAKMMFASLALHHADATTKAFNPVTMGYIQEKVDTMRTYYETRERKLKRLAGLAVEDEAHALTVQQTTTLAIARDMLRNAGIDPDALKDML